MKEIKDINEALKWLRRVTAAYRYREGKRTMCNYSIEVGLDIDDSILKSPGRPKRLKDDGFDICP